MDLVVVENKLVLAVALSLAVSVVVPIAVVLELAPPCPSSPSSFSDTVKFEFTSLSMSSILRITQGDATIPLDGIYLGSIISTAGWWLSVFSKGCGCQMVQVSGKKFYYRPVF